MWKKYELVITSAAIWIIIIIACALTLKDTAYSGRILFRLVVGAVIHAILVWMPMIKAAKKK
jgi:hypothetical protein